MVHFSSLCISQDSLLRKVILYMEGEREIIRFWLPGLWRLANQAGKLEIQVRGNVAVLNPNSSGKQSGN
jgi:hypothetical protein